MKLTPTEVMYGVDIVVVFALMRLVNWAEIAFCAVVVLMICGSPMVEPTTVGLLQQLDGLYR